MKINGWRDFKLGEILEVKHGFAFKGQHFGKEGSHIVLTPGNFLEEGGFKNKGDDEKWYSGPVPEEYVLHRGDLVVAMTDLTQNAPILGSPAFIPTDDRFLHNQRLGKIVNVRQDLAIPEFLYCLFNTKQVRAQIKGSASGATVKHTSPSRIYEVRVSLPCVPAQRRIASILSVYDALIENNLRRIKILEEIARSLYREWFVEFRFPGQGIVPRVASALGRIPKGWRVKPVADSFEIMGGGTPSRAEPAYWQEGTIQWFAPRNLTGADTMFMDDSVDHITPLGLKRSSARLFPPFSVMMTSRATIGAIAINSAEASTNQGFITCIPNKEVPLYFLYHWLKENVQLFERLASGATFKEISRGVFKTIDFLQPTSELVHGFEKIVDPLARQVLTLQRSVMSLRRTRDLLLPRLLSGQIHLNGSGY